MIIFRKFFPCIILAAFLFHSEQSFPLIASRYALQFDGTSLVYLGTDSRLNPRTEYTIEAWTFLEKNDSWRWVFTRWNQNVNGTYKLGIFRGLYRYATWSPQRDIYSIDPQTVGEWVHLAATYEKGMVKMYRNGILQGTATGAGANATNVATLIGNIYLRGDISTGWQGMIDEVRFWNVARTQAQIRETMNLPLTGREPGLIGYWDFNEGQGQMAMDKGPHGLHGILGMDMQDGKDDPVWVVSTSPVFYDRDTDGDGIPDFLEGNPPLPGMSNLYLPDSDGDGLPDGVEDGNQNGIQDAGETSTRDRDTDGDGFTDGVEIFYVGSDPISVEKPGVWLVDLDGDELPDFLDTDSTNPDSDGDRYADGYEAVMLGMRAVGDPLLRPNLGDVTGEGRVDNGDSQLVLTYFSGRMPAEFVISNSDTNRDGFIDNADAQVILQYFGSVDRLLPW